MSPASLRRSSYSTQTLGDVLLCPLGVCQSEREAFEASYIYSISELAFAARMPKFPTGCYSSYTEFSSITRAFAPHRSTVSISSLLSTLLRNHLTKRRTRTMTTSTRTIKLQNRTSKLPRSPGKQLVSLWTKI